MLIVTTRAGVGTLAASFSGVLSALFALSSAELLFLTSLSGKELRLGRTVFRICQAVPAILKILQKFIGLNKVLII